MRSNSFPKLRRACAALTVVLSLIWAMLPLTSPLNFVTSVQAQTTAPAVTVIINELDADQTSTDTAEFVEFYDGGVGNTSLTGLVVVFYNGSNDLSYASFDLDGFTTNAAGYFTLGNSGVAGVDLVFANETLQNGQDAVALYTGDATSFPTNTAVTTANLRDAIVYDTADADDPGLLVLLNASQPQVDENATPNGGAGTTNSNQRCPNGAGGTRNTSTYTQRVPTPDSPNLCGNAALPALSIADVTQSEGNSGTTTFTFTVSLSAAANAGGVTFDIATQNGTATIADTDFVSNSATTQTIATGSQTATFSVTVNGDATVESDETFLVNVFNITGATVADRQATGTITNDDFPDTTAPNVQSIARASANPADSGATVTFTVTFSEAVTGVDAADFALTTTGSISGATISGVSGGGTTYTVTVSTGLGAGTVRLDASDNDSIIDAANNPLGGTGAGNGNFTTGETFTITAVPTRTVNSADDHDDGTCSASDCTLREAINAANADSTVTDIAFNIPAGQAGANGVFTINVGGATSTLGSLPTITRSITIDGYTQPGASANTNPITATSNAVPLIELNGTNAGADSDGLNITAGSTTVRGLIINRFTDDGIELETSGLMPTGNNKIEGCFIGTNAAGTAAQGNADDGVAISDSINNTIGGTNEAARNIISGQATDILSSSGVEITGESSGGNKVQGNFIGTDKTGTLALGNSIGVNITEVFNTNTIGGTAEAERNIISGNGNVPGFESFGGIRLGNATVVQGNYIGTDVTGTAAVPNSDGIYGSGIGGIVIGGTAAGASNLISGNSRNGIFLEDLFGLSSAPPPQSITNGSQASDARRRRPMFAPFTSVEANLIGTDKTGALDLGNTMNGIRTNITGDLIIGGTTAAASNTISGNNASGIEISGATPSGAVPVRIQGNRIGVNLAGTGALGNTASGINLINSASSNVIGGAAAGEGNIIQSNNADGVSVQANAGTGNRIRGNSINGNTGLGIDLGADGVQLNDVGDADTGANNLQNYPLVTLSTTVGGTTTITASLNSTPSRTFTVDYYSNASCDSSGNGEGQTYLGSRDVTTDATGNALSFTFMPAQPVPTGRVITATATDQTTNDTSEFSPCRINDVVTAVPVRLSGRVTGADGGGLADVTVRLLNTASGRSTSAQTDARGGYIFNHVDSDETYLLTPAKDGYRFTPPTRLLQPATDETGINFVAEAATASTSQLRFSSAAYTVSEAGRAAELTVERTGDVSAAATVAYRTVAPARLFNCDPATAADQSAQVAAILGVASPRCDYATTVGTLRFVAGESSKTFRVIITDDSFTEGAETFLVRLLNARGAQLAAEQSLARVTIIDDETATSSKTNPADALEFYIGQQYVDFFGRQAADAEVASWKNAVSEVCIQQVGVSTLR